MAVNKNHLKTLEAELNWLNVAIETRVKTYFNESDETEDVEMISPPDIEHDNSVYAQVLKNFGFSAAERLVIALTVTPYIYPQLLDIFFTKNKLYDKGYTEFGGAPSNYFKGFLPTGETALFLVAGNSLFKRTKVLEFFENTHSFKKFNILKLEGGGSEETPMSASLRLSEEYYSYFVKGKPFVPSYTTNFPAVKIETDLGWDDLVFDDYVRNEIDNIVLWLDNKEKILSDWKLDKYIKPGFRVLFYGPPGTGKTLTASLIGKYTKKDVYRVDLSQVMSKYIGDTEKNLASIFDVSEHKGWILFFDEADALFGKRGSGGGNQAMVQHMNQQIAYLLQRIEDYDGLVILATNLKDNIDTAFRRRFQSMILFSKPNADQRFSLWENMLSSLKLSKEINLKEIANKYDISGGAMINVLRYCALKATQNENEEVSFATLVNGIKLEYTKEGKSI